MSKQKKTKRPKLEGLQDPPRTATPEELRRIYLGKHLADAESRGYFVLPGWLIEKLEICWLAHERACVTQVPAQGHLVVWIKPEKKPS